MLSFSEFDFKWFVHIIDAYNLITCYPYLNFLLFHIWSQWFTYIMALRMQMPTMLATTDMTICIATEICIAIHSMMQMKLYGCYNQERLSKGQKEQLPLQ